MCTTNLQMSLDGFGIRIASDAQQDAQDALVPVRIQQTPHRRVPYELQIRVQRAHAGNINVIQDAQRCKVGDDVTLAPLLKLTTLTYVRVQQERHKQEAAPEDRPRQEEIEHLEGRRANVFARCSLSVGGICWTSERATFARYLTQPERRTASVQLAPRTLRFCFVLSERMTIRGQNKCRQRQCQKEFIM